MRDGGLWWCLNSINAMREPAHWRLNNVEHDFDIADQAGVK